MILTNRERFNQYIRDEVERQIEYYEAMTSEELARSLYDNPGQIIQVKIGQELGFFKVRATGSSCGDLDTMIAWLMEDAGSVIPTE